MRVIAPKIHRRLIAVLCFAVGLSGQMFMTGNEQEPARFLVRPEDSVPLFDAQPEDLRNISEYKYAGFVEVCADSQMHVECPSLREARKFIYASWKAKQKSYIIVHLRCADCFHMRKIFVEPDEHARWKIVIWDGPQRGGPPSEYIAVAIKHERVPADDPGYEKGEQMLVFFDAKGESVGDL